MLVERKACCHDFNAFLSRMDRANLVHIEAENVQKVPFFQKAPGVNGLIVMTKKSVRHKTKKIKLKQV